MLFKKTPIICLVLELMLELVRFIIVLATFDYSHCGCHRNNETYDIAIVTSRNLNPAMHGNGNLTLVSGCVEGA